jgi:protein gp37
MSENSSIEWTDATWNPVRGCTKISPGCKHCYAETFADRFRGVPGHPYEQGFDLRLVPEKLAEPLNWATSKTVFEQVVRVMMLADWHTYQVLTKRADRLSDMLSGPLSFASELGHIWFGVSVENRKHGLPRIDRLREAPAAVRFLSIEPLLENLGRMDLSEIDWVIVGGESGWGARPMDPSWVISIRDQCLRNDVLFFFKQWGGPQKSKSGRQLGDRTYDDMPQRSARSAPPRAERLALIDELTASATLA